MWRKLLVLCLFALFSCKLVHAGAAHGIDDTARIAEQRIALVIGNDAYKNDPLANPVNDARAMSRALRLRGFDVVLLENGTQQAMRQALDAFRQRVDSKSGVGLLYFAGHGLQLADKTLLLPVDADSRVPVSLIKTGIDLREAFAQTGQAAHGKPVAVILDICLNNPFHSVDALLAKSAISATDALPNQSLVAFATRPGALASDGVHHGLYTAALLDGMHDPRASLEQVLQQAVTAVRRTSDAQQIPWVRSRLSRTLPFATTVQSDELLADASRQVIGERQPAIPRSRAILPKDSAEQYELSFWDSIKDSNHIGDFEAYLQAYPNGRFAALAKARIERLRAAASKTETPKEEARTPPSAPPAATPAPKARPEKPRTATAPKSAPEQAAPAANTPSAAPAGERRSAPVAGTEVKDCATCPAMISLHPGAFTMGTNSGDPSEKPAHQVSISAPFAIAKTEVTVEQWNACVAAGACAALSTEANGATNLPARDLSWDDAQAYVKWLSKTTGHPYRLPSEAEWEYAARGGSSTRYWWGEQMKTGNANCKECGNPWDQKKPAPVASFAANPFGLYDMNGSVWEWVGDCWHTSYKGAPADGRVWDMPNCRERVIRGGSWREGASYMPSTTRFKYAASVRDAQNGFRVLKEMK